MGNVRIYRSATKSRLVSFSSDCLRKWRDFSGPITKKSKAKAKPKLKPNALPDYILLSMRTTLKQNQNDPGLLGWKLTWKRFTL